MIKNIGAFILGVLIPLTGFGFYSITQTGDLLLGTSMTGSEWFLNSSSEIQAGASTWGLRIPSLASETCLGTDSNGVFQSGTCSGSGGSSFGQAWELSGSTLRPTTTLSVTGDFFTATSTSSSTLPYLDTTLLSFTTAYGNLTGNVTGNADTATALAANGSNCSAGNAPLGVDASGAVESCFDVWTEAENTSAAYISGITGESLGDLSDVGAMGASSTILHSNGSSAFWQTFYLDSAGGLLALDSQVSGTLDEANIDWTITSSVLDFGGATSLEIPNGVSPTVDATGEIALDTTSNQLKWYGATQAQLVTGTTTKSFNIASTTEDTNGNTYANGTTTLLLSNPTEPWTINGVFCKTRESGDVIGRLADEAGNATEQFPCNSTGIYTSLSTNNTWNAREDIEVQVGSATSTVPGRTTITVDIEKTAD